MATPQSIYPFTYPCYKSIMTDIRMINTKIGLELGGTNRQERQWSQAGSRGALTDRQNTALSDSIRKTKGSLAPSHPTGNHLSPICYVNLKFFSSYTSMFLLFFKQKQHEHYSKYCLFTKQHILGEIQYK